MGSTTLTAPHAAGRLAYALNTSPGVGGHPVVLVVGDGPPPRSLPLPPQPADAVHVGVAAAPSVQLERQAALAVLPWAAWSLTPVSEHRLLVHNLAGHLLPGASLVVESPPTGAHPLDAHADACGLTWEAPDPPTPGWQRYRRTARTTIADLVAEARAGLRRLTPAELAERLQADPACLVLDTRTPTDRARTGVIPGSVHAPRTTLEWQCDPTSGYTLDRIAGFDQPLVVVCNGGHSSSLAAASLQRLGFAAATDLVGGVAAWIAAGLPVEPPDHSHLS